MIFPAYEETSENPPNLRTLGAAVEADGGDLVDIEWDDVIRTWTGRSPWTRSLVMFDPTAPRYPGTPSELLGYVRGAWIPYELKASDYE